MPLRDKLWRGGEEKAMASESKETRLQRLRELAGEPEARSEYAATLLLPKFGLEVVRAALRVLVARPHLPARAALIRLFEHYATQGVTRDPGSYVRSEIVRALRPICEPADVALLEQALLTYEFPAPAFKEEAALLRSGALVVLAEVDDVRARYHATRLLADPLTDPMSGEPALTAVSVLAAQGELLPLYFFVTQEQTRMHAEVASVCLRNLGALPAEAVPPLVACYEKCTDPLLLVGLVDLLVQHPDLTISQEKLARLMVEVKDLDLYRYLAAALLAAGKISLRRLVLEAASGIVEHGKQGVLVDVLKEVGDAEDVRSALAALQAKWIQRPRR
jgi:HEAT repeat protein